MANRSILIVEDNDETAEVLRRILELHGYRTVTATDGLDAITTLRGGLRPTAIILDLWMPNLDGRGFRATQMADPELSRIPVVVYSVEHDRHAVPQVVGHVRKGVDSPDDLLAAVAMACAVAERTPGAFHGTG